jgi:hypothetical protein
MFEGTLRSNLDPFEQHEDRKLLEALDKCLLRDMVEQNKMISLLALLVLKVHVLTLRSRCCKGGAQSLGAPSASR